MSKKETTIFFCDICEKEIGKMPQVGQSVTQLTAISWDDYANGGISYNHKDVCWCCGGKLYACYKLLKEGGEG